MEPTLHFESSSFLFEPGRVYNRRQDLHGEYGGQHQGGISTPADYDLIFLFTSESGSEYGYKDEFRPDGTFWYTGEGQEGDMEMVRGNRAGCVNSFV
jgi:5-methylcytosine-specific restriction protein A